jgi:SAM-dependent methyltransferase
MDYKDAISGSSVRNFYFSGKMDMLNKFFRRIGKNNMKILCVGVGTGEEISVSKKFGNVTVIDNNDDIIESISGVKKYVCDISNMNEISDGVFDVVVCLDVLEHVDDDIKSIGEINRVLKYGGSFIFSVPAVKKMFGYHDVFLGHKRRYNFTDIRNKCTSSGFSIDIISFWNFFLFTPVFLNRKIGNLLNSKPRQDNMNVPRIINLIFKKILYFENRLIFTGIRFPFGVSIVGLCKKPFKE